MLILGTHVHKKDFAHLHLAIQAEIINLKINAVAIFTHGPHGQFRNKYDAKEILECTEDIAVITHCTYRASGIWGVTNENKSIGKSKIAIHHYLDQFLATEEIGGSDFVLHIMKKTPEELFTSMKFIYSITPKSATKLILESPAMLQHKNKTYESPEKINHLTKLINQATDAKWWGWCIDTAHLWAMNVDVQGYESMRDWLNGIAYPKQINVFHLNGSNKRKGCGKDTHEIPFSTNDIIWHGMDPKKSGVRAVIEFATLHSIPCIMEINRGAEYKYIEVIKQLSI